MSMQVIEHIELSSAQSNITFSSIPDTHTDLYLVVSARTDRASAHLDILRMWFNGSTANWSNRQLIGFGSGGGYSETGSTIYQVTYGLTATTATANTFGSVAYTICNYKASQSKSVSADWVIETNATNSWQGTTASLWNDSSAVTSITLDKEFGANFIAGTSATLFGITAGSDGTTAVS